MMPRNHHSHLTPLEIPIIISREEESIAPTPTLDQPENYYSISVGIGRKIAVSGVNYLTFKMNPNGKDTELV